MRAAVTGAPGIHVAAPRTAAEGERAGHEPPSPALPDPASGAAAASPGEADQLRLALAALAVAVGDPGRAGARTAVRCLLWVTPDGVEVLWAEDGPGADGSGADFWAGDGPAADGRFGEDR